ncbi:MAG: YqgE/AlgH family protein [Rickettsiaceae bacterium]
MDIIDCKDLFGKILIATPRKSNDDIFTKSIIYVLSHGQSGSIGVIVNHYITEFPKQLIPNQELINIPENMPIYFGGPIGLNNRLFLHSSDYNKNISIKFNDKVWVNMDNSLLDDIELGCGPEHCIFIMGYTQWGPGQLEMEIQNNMWIVANDKQNIVFSHHINDKWEIALKRVGIEQSSFVTNAAYC